MTVKSQCRQTAKRLALKFQTNFRILPRKICLISGAPRSGTTALGKWLGCQQGIAAFPESRILISVNKFMEESRRFKSLESDSARIEDLARQIVFDYYSNSRMLIGKSLLVDKEPLEPIAFPSKEYGQFIRNVKKILPNSKILFAVRDPIATIWSMSQRTWGESLVNTETRRFTIDEHIENWCSCADLILQYCSDPNIYVVQFGNLINDSKNESTRIYDFLDIRKGNPFEPSHTKEVGFSNKERAQILQKVQPQIKLLECQGISNLS